ncbi:putative oxidoreductase with FAD/NAD(P)-binding domain [Candidatus Sulfopaludibacter sp. SbA3]|nr:putative oxidoreductase with FAD/NAD(P)-binding domain [Candidatus Sulfopaludibacter sp. SbA3]
MAVVEHSAQVGRKILISGGGRCNFTNLHTRPENFLSANPHFAKSALARYGSGDFVALVQRHAIPYHEKTLGQLFCDRSARDVVAMLEKECAAAGVRILTGCGVRGIAPGFAIETTAGRLEAASVVVATGGLSVPKSGATPFGYTVASQFGLRLVECRPALVPLTFGPQDTVRWAGLAGVSTLVDVTAGGHTFREKMLFTHRGLSGPAILQASSYWRPGEAVQIDLLPQIDLLRSAGEARAAGERIEIRTLVRRFLPKSLADRWSELHGPWQPVASLSDRELEALASGLHDWRVEPRGTEGYEKAEVTAGGVDTAELSSKTFEARKAPGLYFIGEVVDVTGQLGGFNFQWAWASGYSAGQYV